jgi:hypothetical protein
VLPSMLDALAMRDVFFVVFCDFFIGVLLFDQHGGWQRISVLFVQHSLPLLGIGGGGCGCCCCCCCCCCWRLALAVEH